MRTTSSVGYARSPKQIETCKEEVVMKSKVFELAVTGCVSFWAGMFCLWMFENPTSHISPRSIAGNDGHFWSRNSDMGHRNALEKVGGRR